MLIATLERPDEVKFYDWGGAVVAHPFASMLVALDSATGRRHRDRRELVAGEHWPHAEQRIAGSISCRRGGDG
jgi:hypothetical protein